MRPVVHEDVDLLARHLLTLPAGLYRLSARKMIANAEAADRYRKRHGQRHRDWGDGTLAALARQSGITSPRSLRDKSYCRALATVLNCLAER